MMKNSYLVILLLCLFSSLHTSVRAQDSSFDFIDVDESQKKPQNRVNPEPPSASRNRNLRRNSPAAENTRRPYRGSESADPTAREFESEIPGQKLEVANPEDVLKLGKGEVRLLPNKDGSFELFVLHVPGRESLLVTDSTSDPDALADNYTLRGFDFHPTFGNEKRILNGKILERDPPLHFLMDSTHERIKGFEPQTEWFHIHLPKAVIYGYPWGREGQFDIKAGTWISLRTFEKPYADYTGKFKDNPFVITSKERPPKEVAREKPFKDLTSNADGNFYNAKDTQDMMDTIDKILEENTGKDMDLAFVLDTTISMKEDIKEIKKKLAPKVHDFKQREENRDKTQRVGMVLYRDYPPDRYLTREKDFTEEMPAFEQDLQIADAAGGYDTPEAVYEGIDAAINKLSWSQPKRVIVQIGDAVPHPEPKGKITEQGVLDAAAQKNISIHSILLPKRK